MCFFVTREKNGETAAKKRRTFLPKSAPFFLHYSNSNKLIHASSSSSSISISRSKRERCARCSFFFHFCVDDGFLPPRCFSSRLARILLSLFRFERRESKKRIAQLLFSLSLASYFLYLAGASLESLSSLSNPWL